MADDRSLRDRFFSEEDRKAFEDMASALKSAGVEAAVQDIGKALVSCVDSAQEFERGMTQVFALLPDATAEAREKMSADLLAFSSDMNVLTEEAAPALYEALSSGVPEENVFDFLTVAQKAAAGGAGDLKTAVEDLSSVVSGYGGANLSAQAAADKLFSAAQVGRTGFDQMASAIRGVVPAAAEAQVELGDIAAAMGAVTASGTPAEEAAGQLRKMLEELSEEGSQAGQVFRSVAGEDFKAFIAGGNGLQDALRLLERQAETSGTGISGMFGSVEAGQAALALTGEGTAKFSAALEAMDASCGAVDAAYQSVADTAEFQSQRVDVAFENLKIAVGDSLKPAFAELAGAAAGGLEWAAGFIEQNPWLVKALGAVTVAVAVFAGGVSAYTLAVKLASAATEIFGLVTGAAAGPILLVTSAAAGLIAAVGMMAASMETATSRSTVLADSIAESRRVYDESVEGIQRETGSTMELVTALDALYSQEDKGAAGKAAILELVDQLNEAVPDLALAYDSESDSLNMTTEALQGLVEAEAERELRAEAVDRMVQLKKDEVQITAQLEGAQRELTEAEGALAESGAELQDGSRESARELQGLKSAVSNAEREVQQLTELQAQNAAEAEGLQAQFEDLTKSMETSTGAAGDNGKQNRETVRSVEELTEAAQALTGTTEGLISAQDGLSAALKEQEEAGSLSLDTALDLIDAGYASALCIDEETGAITLNKDTYIALAKAKMEEQLASIESQKTSLDAAIRLREEAYAAQYAAVGYLEVVNAKKMAKAIETDGELQDLYDQASAYDAQSASIKRAMDSLGSYSGAAASAAKSTSRTAEKVKTQAEKDLATFERMRGALDHSYAMGEKSAEQYYLELAQLQKDYLSAPENQAQAWKIDEEIHGYDRGLETYKRLRAELDHQRNMGLKSEADYYAEAARLRDEWLTSEAAQEERRGVDEELFQYYWDELDEAAAGYEEQVDRVAKAAEQSLGEVQKAYDQVIAKQDAMADKLGDYGALYEMDDGGGVELTDIREQMDALNEYSDTLARLKENGVSQGLLNEIVDMGIDEGTAYGAKLLEMAEGDEEAWEQYNRDYEDKQKLALEIAEEFYQEQLDTITAEYDDIKDQLADDLEDLKDQSFEAGKCTVGELADGIKAKEAAAVAAAREMVRKVEAEFAKMQLPSLAVNGSHADGLSYVPFDGYIAELHKGEMVMTAAEARGILAAAMPRRFEPPAQPGGGALTSALINSLLPAIEHGGGDRPVVIQLELDKKQIASAVYDPLKDEGRRRGGQAYA